MDTHEFDRVRAANAEMLAPIEQFFLSQGRVVTRAGDCLRCELAIGSETYGVDYVVSADFLFTLNEHPFDQSRMTEYDVRDELRLRERYPLVFRNFQYELMENDLREPSRKELRLFVLTAPPGLDAPAENGQIAERRIGVESDEAVALKHVVTYDQFEDLQTNPFGASRIPSGVAQPSFDTVGELYDLKDDAPPATAVFSNRDARDRLDMAEFSSEAFEPIRRRVLSILLRIAGPRHPVYAYAVMAASGKDPEGNRFTFMSDGEHKAFHLALYLARHADSVGPETMLGIYGTLNGLSLIWRVGALSTLREFVAVTGASVRLQAPHNDRRQHAQRMMKPVAKIVDYRALRV